ncbi:hypothetical protein [Enterococcus casseliflavus]|uniref:hypothetical protein n=1 Tax=Enterococcus casseliflavus TaxID=37734 RepID=UPI003DA39796
MKMIKLGLSLILVFSMLLQIIQLITNLRLFKKYAGVKKNRRVNESVYFKMAKRK